MTANYRLKTGLVAGLLATSFAVSAAVQVVESKSVDQLQYESKQEQQNTAVMNLYNQLQIMQEELMQLRGIVEEQDYQLQQLKQQQQDDYIQLDSRITELGSSSLDSDDTKDSAQNAYQEAYQLIQQRKFKDAITAFEAFCENYPTSNMKANALYWLGELYIVDGNDKKARESFEEITKQYSNNRKYPEAVYKLAVLDVQQGHKEKAKQAVDRLLKQIDDDNTYASLKDKVLAFKNEHFP